MFLKKYANCESKSGNEHNCKTPVNEKNRPGIPDKSVPQQNKTQYQQCADSRSPYYVVKIGDTGVAPHAAVKIEKIKTCDFDDQHVGQHLFKDYKKILRYSKIESDKIGSVQRSREKEEIRNQNNKKIFI
jgi:hypothetical protein